VTPLKEEDAYPADPEDGYGWEKTVQRTSVSHYYEDHGLETRVVRFHNIFGLSAHTTAGERSPRPPSAGKSRWLKMATRSKCGETDIRHVRIVYIDDCVIGIYKLMQSNHREPLNLGQESLE